MEWGYRAAQDPKRLSEAVARSHVFEVRLDVSNNKTVAVLDGWRVQVESNNSY